MGYGCRKMRLFSKVRYKTYCAISLWDNKCQHAALGAVGFLYDIKILKLIEFLFERDFMYAWNRKLFSMICFCIWFKFNIVGITMPCA